MDKKVENNGNMLYDLELMCNLSNSTSLIMGFPDYNPPENLIENVKEAVGGKNVLLNQYSPRKNGHLPLLQALADVYSPKFNRTLDPLKNVATSIGATGALVNLFRAFSGPGDEVIIFEPFFCPYKGYAKTAGSTPVFIPLRLNRSPDGTPPTSADFTFDRDELEAAFTEKTKMIVCNSPQNPTGKMFTREELEVIADLCNKHDVICVADDVYEMFAYSETEHIKIATLPGMWERTVTVASIGKFFGMTAWATGFLIGPDNLIEKVLAEVIYPLNTALQEAYANAYRTELARLDRPDSYFKVLPKKMKAKRDFIVKMVQEIGLEPIVPQGGYFVFVDVSEVADEYCQGDGDKASNFAFWLCKEKGLGVAPANVFYSNEHKHLGANYIRICHIKSEKTLETAEKQLQGLHVTSHLNGSSNGVTNGIAKKLHGLRVTSQLNGSSNGVSNGIANGHHNGIA